MLMLTVTVFAIVTIQSKTDAKTVDIDNEHYAAPLYQETEKEDVVNPNNVNKYGFADEALLNAAELNPVVTNDRELDRQVAWLIDDLTDDTMSNFEKVLFIYMYIESNFYYRSSYIPSSNRYISRTDNCVTGRAKGILATGHGTCTEYAALFTVMMRALGFEAYSVEGHYGGGQHTWTVMVLDGNRYIFDTEIDFRIWQRTGEGTLAHFCMDETFKDYRYYHANTDRWIKAYHGFELDISREKPDYACQTYTVS